MRISTLFKKSILIIIMVVVLGLFTGCVIIIPVTGAVHINITNSDWAYYIYLDSHSNLLGTTNYYGQATFYNVPTGFHTFYAEDIDGWDSGQRTQYIHSGTNQVNIQVYFDY